MKKQKTLCKNTESFVFFAKMYNKKAGKYIVITNPVWYNETVT